MYAYEPLEGSISIILETLRPGLSQKFRLLGHQIRQCQQDVEAIRILIEPAIPYFPKTESPLERPEYVLNAAASARLLRVCVLLSFCQWAISIRTLKS